MVSLQASLSMKEKNPFPSNQKRKREEEEEASAEDKAGFQLKKNPKLWKPQQLPKLDSFIELNLDTPLPLEWQRCLDIKSGEIHFYNTMTKLRTFKDPRWSRETHKHRQTLDLELNLMCESSEIHDVKADQTAFDHDDVDEQEMMAIVCGRCHMLVMMCKASPLCPNCKFAPPPPAGPESKPKVRLLSCSD